MGRKLRLALRRLGRLEWIFLALLAVAVVVRLAAPNGALDLFATLAAALSGVAAGIHLLAVGVRRLIWRLRYRLMVTYLFIAVVPIGLLLWLIYFGAGILMGQMASYMVLSELERRANAMYEPALGLTMTPPEQGAQSARWLRPYLEYRFPGYQMLIRWGKEVRFPEGATIAAPPRGWGNTSGLMERGDRLYLWAHATNGPNEVTMLVPMTSDFLASLVPNLGALSLERTPSRSLLPRSAPGAVSIPSKTGLPPAANRLDMAVTNAVPVPVAIWDAPGQNDSKSLFLATRYSILLRTIFGQNSEWSEGVSAAWAMGLVFWGVLGLLLIVELVSVIIGIRLTQTVTGAVHNLYLGTQRVREGDFSHRIEVCGDDQLANLGQSFNSMTENLERLVEVAKEKERLQSEIEIAREVQNQLFPKATPVSKSLRLNAACTPARLVSGDYYDYLNLCDSKIAFAIGDVAGKGISAALLMATVQSTMRTQLRAGREMAAAAAGDGGTSGTFSTAGLVSRLNQQLYAYTPPEKFATFYFAIYDDDTGWMQYTNAGHLPPVLVRRGQASRLEVTGTVVGAFGGSQYEEASLQLERGDLLVCFTDGLTEPENEFGEMFGEDRLADVAVKNADRESSEIVAAIMDSVRNWTGSPELQDDMTLLLARRI
jgi:sigma-B regulation protein RsbU (phosphoserine phosphatase)